MSRQLSLHDKTIVITGAAGGIGSALAQRFGAGGARLGLLDIDQDRLDRLVAELEGNGIESLALACDITHEEDCQAALASIEAAYDGVDVLINNAGMTHLSPFAETESEVYRRLMNVNLFGAIYTTKAALTSLLARRGTVIVISSVAGFSPLAMRSGYAASKHALHGFFDTIRAELEPRGLKVMVVCPGFTRTDIGKRALGGDGGPAHEPRSSVGHHAEPAEVAESIYRGVLEGRRLLVLSPVGKLAYLISRVAPSLYQKVMMRSLTAR